MANPFPCPAKPSCARDAQDLANWHWFELSGALDIQREAEDYLARWRGDSVAYAGALKAAADAADHVRYHRGQYKHWAHRAQTLRAREAQGVSA